jgi:hypothetical protein
MPLSRYSIGGVDIIRVIWERRVSNLVMDEWEIYKNQYTDMAGSSGDLPTIDAHQVDEDIN